MGYVAQCYRMVVVSSNSLVALTYYTPLSYLFISFYYYIILYNIYSASEMNEMERHVIECDH